MTGTKQHVDGDSGGGMEETRKRLCVRYVGPGKVSADAVHALARYDPAEFVGATVMVDDKQRAVVVEVMAETGGCALLVNGGVAVTHTTHSTGEGPRWKVVLKTQENQVITGWSALRGAIVKRHEPTQRSSVGVQRT